MSCYGEEGVEFVAMTQTRLKHDVPVRSEIKPETYKAVTIYYIFSPQQTRLQVTVEQCDIETTTVL